MVYLSNSSVQPAEFSCCHGYRAQYEARTPKSDVNEQDRICQRHAALAATPNVEVTGARLQVDDQRAMLPARPGRPPC